MRRVAAVLLSLVMAAVARGGELDRERARAALIAGELGEARELSAQAVRDDGTVASWRVYAETAARDGLWPLAQAELAAEADELPELALVAAEQEYRLGLIDFEQLTAVATEHPGPGRAVVARARWDENRTLAPWLVTPLVEAPRSEDEARLRLLVYATADQPDLVAAVGQAWLHDHPNRPDVLAEAWGGGEAARLERIRKRWQVRIGRRAFKRWDDPTYLYRAERVLEAAGDSREQQVAERIGQLGFRVPRSGDDALENLVANTLRAADALRRQERFDEAVQAWEELRATDDSFAAALEHARLLQVLEREEEAWTVAMEARQLASAAVPEDAGGLDTSAHAARLADAHGLLAELALTLGHTRMGREAAAVARALDPHPRWVALQAQAEVIPLDPDDASLPKDERVQAVIDTLHDPTNGDAWRRRAEAHEAASELPAAFVAWVVARANGADVGDAIDRTWNGAGNPQVVADAALEAFHAARRSHRQGLAQIRSDQGAAPIVAQAVAPGPGLLLPAWEAIDVAGNPLKSEDLKGEPYVLAVWASWCLPCLEELPLLNREVHLLAKEGTRVKAVAISVDDRQIVFERRTRADAWSDLSLAWNTGLAGALGVDGLPTSFAVDAEGRIVHVERGYSEQGVKRLLQHAADARE